MLKTVLLVMLAVVAFEASVRGSVLAADGTKDKAVEVTKQFVQALKAKDIDAVIKISGVPWFDAFEERLVKDEPELKRFWTEKLRDFDYSATPLESVRAEFYSDFRDRPPDTGDEEQDALERKIKSQIVGEFDKVLDRRDWIVTIADKNGFKARFVLVRIRNGKAAIVGGPSGQAYLCTGNRIPKAARTLLATADGFRLLSLDPKPLEKQNSDFHDRHVLGAIDIDASQADTRKKLVNALKQAADEGDCAFAGCFIPRHGLRVSRNGKTVDFVICFECHSVLVYFDDEKDSGHVFQISGSTQRVFDDVLRAADIPLAEKPGKK